MPETRYVKEFTNGVLTAEIPWLVFDEQLSDEAEQAEVAWDKLSDTLDDTFSAQQALILKKVFGRLFKNGLLP